MLLVEQRDPEVPVDAACVALNVSRASLYRSRRPETPPVSTVARARVPSPRRLDDAERQHLLDTLHLAEFADQPPSEVYATLLGRGEYLASIRTMYRVLAEADENKDRRNQRAPQQHTMPSLTATAPNQVWTWDITKLATVEKGVLLMALRRSTEVTRGCSSEMTHRADRLRGLMAGDGCRCVVSGPAGIVESGDGPGCCAQEASVLHMPAMVSA